MQESVALIIMEQIMLINEQSHYVAVCAKLNNVYVRAVL